VADTKTSVFTIRIDGRDFPLELKSDPGLGFTPREWGELRRIADVKGAPEFGAAFRQQYPLLVAAMALIVLRRAGQPVDEDAMLDGAYILEVIAPKADRCRPPDRRRAGEPALGYLEDPRAYWVPILSDVFGIQPWQMVDLTLGEYRAIGGELQRRAAAAKKAASRAVADRTLTVKFVGDADKLLKTSGQVAKNTEDTVGKHVDKLHGQRRAPRRGVRRRRGREEGRRLPRDATKAAIADENAMTRAGVSVKNAGENWNEAQAPRSPRRSRR
jgi:hypothetical protein